MSFRMNWKGGMAKQRAKQGAVNGLFEASEYSLESANRTVPHEDGDLQASGGTDVDQQNLKASVYYDTPYARRQHEELTWQHDPGRRAKWLELTMQEEKQANKDIVGKNIKDALR